MASVIGYERDLLAPGFSQQHTKTKGSRRKGITMISTEINEIETRKAIEEKAVTLAVVFF